jgi:hypothetical protein
MTEQKCVSDLMHRSHERGHDMFDVLKTGLQTVDPRGFEFMKMSRRVCLIRRDDAAEATGSLIGPDMMLTTAHALMGTSGIFADPANVEILFDQFEWDKTAEGTAPEQVAPKRKAAKGKAPNPEELEESCRLRRLPANTKQPDVLASSIKVDPTSTRQFEDNDLDYILVRLDRPMGLAFLPLSYRIRGWNNCSRAEVPAAGQVFVVQHPSGGVQEFAPGYIRENNIDPEFPRLFQYKTEALNGSSGSPICDRQRRVVGMHVGERSKSEQLGVSFQPIFADLQKEGVKLPPFRLNKDVMDSIFGTSDIEQWRKHGYDWRGDRLFDDIQED